MGGSATPCASTDYDLTSQVEVDALEYTSSTGVSGHLYIEGESEITSIDGLAKLTSVAAYLSIYDNSALTNCQGIATVLGLPNGPPDDNVGGDITVANNTSDCNSIGEILEVYSYSLPEIISLALLTTMQGILGTFEATSTPPEEVLQNYKTAREAPEEVGQPKPIPY